MTASYILALDQGTTSSRAILFDRRGRMLQVAQKEFTQIYPRPGWVEHSPDEIFDTQAHVARDCLRQAGVQGHELAAVGITNQRETTVVWDRAGGAPVYNAIVWQDRRTANVCDRLRAEGKAEIIRQKTGLVLDAYFSGTKIGWILDNVPGARARAEAGELLFGTVDSWLIWNFSKRGAHLTDPSNAGRTLLFNIHTGQWDDELLDLLGVPRAMLPEVVPSSSLMARVHPEFFGHPVPVAGAAGDQQAALFGQQCIAPFSAKTTYGTGCFIMLNTGDRPHASANNLLATVAWQLGGKTTYALEGSVFVGGSVIQWLRDGLKLFSSSADSEPLAASVEDTGGVYLVPALTGLGAPYWDPYARGTIVGITRGTKREHIIRAAQESIAYQSADLMWAMEKDTDITISTLKVDGGASRDHFLMQFQSDILNKEVLRPAIRETTALGAAYLAGLATGVWKSREEISHLWSCNQLFEPKMDAAQREKLVRGWHKAVGRSQDWAEHEV